MFQKLLHIINKDSLYCLMYHFFLFWKINHSVLDGHTQKVHLYLPLLQNF